MKMKKYLLLIVFLLVLLPVGVLRAETDVYNFYEEEQLKKLLQETYRWQEDLVREEAQLSELARQRAELKIKLKELVRAVAQEKAIAEVMIREQRDDQIKLRAIERLWRKATKLYDNEKYEEAIGIFQQILDLESEGNTKKRNGVDE